MSLPPDSGRVLVAGIGNIFLGDDGFGVETVRALTGRQLPGHVEVVDIGVRGVHLAYQLLDGYETLILVDATARGEDPGTLYVIEHDTADGGDAEGVPLDGHRMTLDSVLALLGTLCAGTGGRPPRRTLVVGCEPASVEERIGLSPQVSEAVPEAVRLIEELLRADEPEGPAPQALAGKATTQRRDAMKKTLVGGALAAVAAAVAAAFAQFLPDIRRYLRIRMM